MNRELSPATRAKLEKATLGCSGGYFNQLDRILSRAKAMAEGLEGAAIHADFTGLDILSDASLAALSGALAKDIEAALILLHGLYDDQREADRAADGQGVA